VVIMYVCVRVAVKFDCSCERGIHIEIFSCTMVYIYVVADVSDVRTF
jgi:hypothetical protein